MLGWRQAATVAALLTAIVVLLEWRMSAIDRRLNDRMTLYLHEQANFDQRLLTLEHRR